jgi:hypothetical protein
MQNKLTKQQEVIEKNQNALSVILIISVLLLSVSQFMLYRNIEHVKNMISVSVMELKEGRGVKNDAVLMREGKVYVRQGGEEKLVVEQMELKDGSNISSDGTLVRSNGEVVRLSEGQEVSLGK